MLSKLIMQAVWVLAIGCSVAFAQGGGARHAKNQNVEKEIKRLEQERFNAYLKLDVSTLERITSSDYTSVYADGQVVTRGQELESIKSAPASSLSSLSATIDELSVRQFGLSAVLRGRLMIKGTINWSQKTTNINAAFRYTATYARQSGRWRVVASQFTKIDQPVDE